MPYPARISQSEVLRAARELLEVQGVDGLSMRALARRLGVQAPSLYFYVESRADLLRELSAAGLAELGQRLEVAKERGDGPRAQVHELAAAYIEFAEKNPALFLLMFGPGPEERRPAVEVAEAASRPVLEIAATLVGEGEALPLAAVLWSLVHGYTVLRLAGQFRINPEHERSLHHGLDLLVDAAGAAS